MVPTIDALARISDEEFNQALDDWEDLVMDLEIPSHIVLSENKIYIATEKIFELGRCNMYSKFDTGSAKQAFIQAAKALNELCFLKRVYSDFDLSKY